MSWAERKIEVNDSKNKENFDVSQGIEKIEAHNLALEIKKAADQSFIWGAIFGCLVMFLLLQWVFRPSTQAQIDYRQAQIEATK